MQRRFTLPAPAHLVLVACAGLVATAASAQNPTFEERTRVFEITIPVNVTDRSGSPVRGLTAADFVVLDQGREPCAGGVICIGKTVYRCDHGARGEQEFGSHNIVTKVILSGLSSRRGIPSGAEVTTHFERAMTAPITRE